jgi:hypothetical protein
MPAITLSGQTELNDGGNTFTLGYQFKTNSTLTVTGLGIYVGNGKLTASHDAGLWIDGGAMIASATITPADPIVNGFALHAITPIVLPGGGLFDVGAESANGDGTSQTFAYQGTLTQIPQISWTEDRFAGGSSLAYPGSSEFGGSVSGFFGGNIAVGSAVVPEPSSLILLGVGGLGLCGYCWRRRKLTAQGA